MGRQPAVIASNDDASPSLRAAGFATHLRDALPWHLGTGFVSGCIDVGDRDLYRCTSAWTHDPRGVCTLRAAACRLVADRSSADRSDRLLGGWLGSRVSDGAVRVLLLEPAGLGVDAGDTHTGSRTPRTGHAAGRATEARDHLAAAATGHTLPRLMGCRLLTLALATIAAVAWHEPFRLAFRA
jgi:hypothetical protein